MKGIIKICIIVLLSIMCFAGGNATDCTFDENSLDIKGSLEDCVSNTAVLNVGDVQLEGNFKDTLKSWTDNIALFLGIFAVGSIVYGALLMTISAGDDEKVKKSKDVVKWGILGFLAIVTASSFIKIVVNIMYSV